MREEPMDTPYGGKPPHVDSDTSIAAAASIASAAESIRAQVLQYVADSPAGATDNELENALGLRHQTASPRRRELVLMGFLRDSGDRRKTDSGRGATVWCIVPDDERATARADAEAQGLRNKIKTRTDGLGPTQCQAVLDYIAQLPPEPEPDPEEEPEEQEDPEFDILSLFEVV